MTRAAALMLALAVAGGCATTGPSVSRQEVQAVKDELDARSLREAAEGQQRVWRVAEPLINALPDQDAGPYPDAGLSVANIDRAARLAFGYKDTRRGVYVLAIRPDGAAATAGLEPGDRILTVDGDRVISAYRVRAAFGRKQPGDTCTLTIARRGDERTIPLTLGARPRRIDCSVLRHRIVNAWTDGLSGITITSGMLRFLESDDELAVILGHEVAHITERHFLKKTGVGAVATAVGAGLGVAADIALPGLGGAVVGLVSGTAQAALSRNYEREADYKGLLHTFRGGYDPRAAIAVWERFATEIPRSLSRHYLSTHPTSPERLARLRKVADSLKMEGLEATVAKYERRS